MEDKMICYCSLIFLLGVILKMSDDSVVYVLQRKYVLGNSADSIYKNINLGIFADLCELQTAIINIIENDFILDSPFFLTLYDEEVDEVRWHENIILNGGNNNNNNFQVDVGNCVNGDIIWHDSFVVEVFEMGKVKEGWV